MVSLGLGQKQLQGPPLPPQVQQVLETQSGGVGGKLMQWPPALSAHQPRGQPWASSRSNISAPLLFETRPLPTAPAAVLACPGCERGSPNFREGWRDWRLNVRPCGDPAIPAVRLLPPGNPGGPGEGAAAAGAGLRG